MSTLARHDDECNAGDMAAAPEPTSRPLTNVNTADAAVETRTLVAENPPRKKVRRLRWTTLAPNLTHTNNGAAKKSYPVLHDKYNWMDGALVNKSPHSADKSTFLVDDVSIYWHPIPENSWVIEILNGNHICCFDHDSDGSADFASSKSEILFHFWTNSTWSSQSKEHHQEQSFVFA